MNRILSRPGRPQQRLRSGWKAAERQGKERSKERSCKKQRGGKGERGSRPALLPESRMTLGRKVRCEVMDVLANAGTNDRY